jgi:glycosyltransferase involved in cell wall biosynthesis
VSDLVEIRIPTYKRPLLLQRNLQSLINQTHSNWVAIVFDDSHDREAKEVVDKINDERIFYLPNQRNLGCSQNIDQAFSSKAYSRGRFACVIEDDNWVLPKYLEENIKEILLSKLRILLRNQVIHIEFDSGENVATGKTTRGQVFGDDNAILSPLMVHAAMFFGTGLSNGGIFWEINPEIDFAVGSPSPNSQMQEYLRSLKLNENIFYAADPLAVFSLPATGATSREILSNRQFNRGKIEIISFLLKKYRNSITEMALKLAACHPDLLSQYKSTLSYCSESPFDAWKEMKLAGIFYWVKGNLVKLLIKNPISINYEKTY